MVPAKIQHTVTELEALVGREQWESVKDAAVRLRYLEGIDRAAKKWMDNH
jgi:molecular chaperone HscB